MFSSCGSNSLEDFQDDASVVIKKLIVELQQIQNQDDLIHHSSQLKGLFNSFVDVMIAAHEFKEKKQPDDQDLSFSQLLLSEQLRKELNRVYKMEGGRDIIEHYQQDALNRLDAYLKNVEKKRSVKKTNTSI